MAVRLGQEEIKVDPRAVELLRSTLIGQLGYIGLDGYPRVLPVWFEWRDGELLIGSKAGLYKGRALARDGRVSLAVSTEHRPYHIVVVVGDATVELLREAERIPFVTALAQRYLGEKEAKEYLEPWMKGGHPGDGELIRVRPRTINFYLS